MPLHAENKMMSDAFDAFDDPVVGDRVEDESLAQSFDRLMMGSVDL